APRARPRDAGGTQVGVHRSGARSAPRRRARTSGRPARRGSGWGARHDFPGGSMVTSVLPIIGRPAPDFSLPSTTGENISLKQFKGKKTVVLYFYPKDETPGCTREACDFRDHTEEFEKVGALILGTSTYDMASHQHCREKPKPPSPLLV